MEDTQLFYNFLSFAYCTIILLAIILSWQCFTMIWVATGLNKLGFYFTLYWYQTIVYPWTRSILMLTIRIRCSVNRWLAKKLLHFQGLQNVNRHFIKLFEKNIAHFLNKGNELCSIAINLNHTFSLQSLTNNYILWIGLIMKICKQYFYFKFSNIAILYIWVLW